MRSNFALSLAVCLLGAEWAFASQCKPRSVSSSATSGVATPSDITLLTPSETSTPESTPVGLVTTTPSAVSSDTTTPKASTTPTATPKVSSTPNTPTSSAPAAATAFSLFPGSGNSEGNTVKGAWESDAGSVYVDDEHADLGTVLFTIEEGTGRLKTTTGDYVCAWWYYLTVDLLPAQVHICSQAEGDGLTPAPINRIQYITCELKTSNQISCTAPAGHCEDYADGRGNHWPNCLFNDGLIFDQFYVFHESSEELWPGDQLWLGLTDGGYQGYESVSMKYHFQQD
ncbi:hypothetical protein EDB80DRAFT_887166 [Ilyonectria destructans]|nr:hypothetical protein EDB80DRAFT_887166 [Ilyonectria destructans]